MDPNQITEMNAILDVWYGKKYSIASCVRFSTWIDGNPIGVRITKLPVQAKYEPGMFYRRELPCLMHALQRESMKFNTLIIDGYVHLKPPRNKGLGLHLAESLGYEAVIIGVAKNPLTEADRYSSIYRGKSKKPLFISAFNMSLSRAADLIGSMHGEYRIPTLIKMADTLCRE